MPLAPGTLLNNRYRIVSILGQGGMGAVYRASDDHLMVPVAVKENLFLTDEYARQFQREAHILAGLRHSNLPHVTDYFYLDHQGQYLVMDYVEGEDLRQRMERMANLPEREVTLVGISICEALTYLHTRRPAIVHRDIKPGNIKVTPDGQAVLVDFGLAKIMQGSQATSTGARAMTPGYSPPEQYGTARTDPRSDIYSLGATLYAALTGVIPEDGLARMTGKAELTPIRELLPRVNRRLAESVEKALEVDPEDRYQTAENFKRALVEAGELNPLFQDRPTIAPPPDSLQAQQAGQILNENEEEKKVQNHGRPSSRKKRQMQRRLAFLSIPLALLILIGVLVALFLPEGARAMLLGAANVTRTPESTGFIGTANLPAQTTLATTATSTLTPQPSATPQVEATATKPVVQPEQATPTLSPSPSPSATPRGGAAQIAFASDRSGVMQIWVMNGDGTQQRQLTGISGGACQPTWSPDGKQIAFISPCPGRRETYPTAGIHILNLETNEVTDLKSSLEGDYDPAWSPDGKQIAFTSLRRTGKPTIYSMDLATGETRQISLESRFPDRQPSWRLGGMQIAYVRQFATSQIWYMSFDGQFHQQFSVSGNVNNLWPAWSSDGEVVFYSQTSIDIAIPWLVGLRYEDRKSSEEFRIPNNTQTNPGPIAEISPSPDNSWLAYTSWPDGNNFDIFIMKTNGSGPLRLTTDPGVDFDPAWRPLQP